MRLTQEPDPTVSTIHALCPICNGQITVVEGRSNFETKSFHNVYKCLTCKADIEVKGELKW